MYDYTVPAEINPLFRAWTVGKGTYHIAHLVSDILEPCLDSLRSRNHSGDLGTNDWLVSQGLSKRLTLVDPFETALNDVSLRTSRATTHDPSLVVEVAAMFRGQGHVAQRGTKSKLTRG